jgi:hypothetical protein
MAMLAMDFIHALHRLRWGRGTHAENTRMVMEKDNAFAEAATSLAFGGSAQKVIRRYRKHVRANGRRLRKRS